MKAVRFLVTILAAGLLVPLLANVIQQGAIGLRNGHWFGWAAALLQSSDFLPLAVLILPLHATSALIVAAFSLGLEWLVKHRSIMIWITHGLAMSLLQLLWFWHHFTPSWSIVLGAVGPWLLVSSGMWAILSRGQPLHGHVGEFPV